ncbi:hypothetical protein POJ06DRAFT_107005 [Lipomyces tetrasporus]|uniref:Uncharacterized protein n=1 Tax=Lipomyces tetrasporus TaxID=54092 RepID=A0AAD7QSF0_9ASCO|nr:uncharacterized protein POJ06DRAFT_107005 [Lipomyces tetrasporus]KAJ8100559.1 hypothetical protein POJ06DRAFT_107005 [Lipomyces tetrasporus]
MSSDRSSGAQSPALLSLPYIVDWDVEEVGNWLERIGLWQYHESFAENDITGEVLIHLDHDFLKDLGVSSVGHRLQILKAVYNIKIAQDIPIEAGQFVPISLSEQEVADHETVDVQRLMKSLEIRDRKLMHAEQEIRRLMENYHRLREDLLPIFKMVKESKPLPMPDYPPTNRSSLLQSSYAVTSDPPPSILSSRHSMFIPSSQPILGGPSVNNFSQQSQSSSSHQGLSRKLSTKKINTSKTNSSPTHTPEWLEQTLIPSSSSANNNGASLSSTAPSSTPTSVAAPLTSPLANISSPKDLHQRNMVTSPSILSQPSQHHVSSTVPISSAFPSSLTLSEAFKPFKLKQDDPCYKVLPAVLKGHKINDDWRQYALLVCFGDQERLLGLDEKPLRVLKELQDAGKQPVFMLRPIQGMKHEQGAIVTGTPGGVL